MSNNSVLTKYFKPITSLTGLSDEETLKLIKLTQEGKEASKEIKEGNYTDDKHEELSLKVSKGENALDRLLLHNKPLIMKLAKKYCFGKNELDDLIMAGKYALINAIINFDVTKNSKLGTYSYKLIQQAIAKESFINNIGFPLTDHEYRTIISIRKAFKKLEIKLNREPSDEEIKNYLNLSDTVYNRYQELSFNITFSYFLDDITIYEFLYDKDNFDEEIHKLKMALLDLSKEENLLLDMRYVNRLNNAEIGRELGLSRETVRVKLNNAEEKLKNILKRDK